jgi:glucosamine kinase
VTLLLTLDVGGSATRWVLRDARGERAQGELPPASGHLFVAAEEARFRALAEALAHVLPARPEELFAGITGLEATAPEAALAAAILAEAVGVHATAVTVTNDVNLAYRTAFAPGEGHLVYAGTGSIALHIRADGTEVRAGGRGMLIDDAGSAFWIGQRALRRTWREREENPAAPLSPLARALAEAMGGEAWDHQRAHVYSGGRDAIAQLARSVATVADAEDIFLHAGRELARLANILVRLAGPKPVALAGRAWLLHPAMKTGFHTALAEDVSVR